MQPRELPQAKRFSAQKRRRRIWLRAVTCLACVVVFCTVYALILPAITMEPEPVCGLEAHVHDETCYSYVPAVYEQQLSCLTASLLHRHTADCYNENGDLICGQADFVIHYHDSSCYDAAGNLVCPLPVIPEHVHTEECYSGGEGHLHTEECYETRQQLTCGLEESEGHLHDESCYDETGALICGLEENAGHVHSSECYAEEEVLICGLEETEGAEPELICELREAIPHVHEASCYDGAGNLICGRLETRVHQHNESCMTEVEISPEQEILTCGLPEHVHTDDCYPQQEPTPDPIEEEPEEEVPAEEESPLTDAPVYCGKEAHTHSEECYWYGQLACELEEHIHTEECYIAPVAPDADPNAGLETQADWESTMADVTLTGEYRQDVLAIAESQLGYTACAENYILDENGQEKRISRYGQWYGDPYGDWCAMFVSFCLHYADVDEMPLNANCQKWIETLSKPEYNLFHEAGAYTPIPGDLIFFDCNTNGTADHVGLVYTMTEATEAEPAKLKTIERYGDQVQTRSYYLPNTDITGFASLPEKRGADLSPSEPSLTDDSAYVSELSANGASILSGSTAPSIDSSTVHNQDTIAFAFSVVMQSYFNQSFGQGRVKLEFVLPLSEEQAVFNMQAMTWLDRSDGYAPVITSETRVIDDTEIPCQVLTGYKLLSSEDGGSAIPGGFTESVLVTVLNMAHGETIAVQIHAAMEYSAWTGTCETHQVCEKLTIVTNFLSVDNPLSAEEQQAVYAEFLAEIEALEAVGETDEETTLTPEDILERLQEAYQQGRLSEQQYTELYERVLHLLDSDYDTIAEPAVGTNWLLLRDSGWFEAYSNYAYASANHSQPRLYAEAANAVAVMALDAEDDPSTAPPSNVQVSNKGGTNTSDDRSVSVSKTISGTDLENVFDITLQVQTSLNVNEICEEPDMAVVIVMDISNTMNSNFGGVTRYAAAMTAAENFLDQFASNNSLGISKVGYVAFNTDAHQIFGLQSCSTAEQAAALKNTMRTQTGSIINDSDYNSSHSRFTNVEAGLAMAADMLNGVANQNKYIIFLSDGFPTTYISSGYSGYDPYDSTGRFYDHVLNKPCLYGTSYSDEAAIRARNKAAAIKGSGVSIFSIGVDVAGQTIQKYITQSENANGFSVVDRTGTTYEIGDASSTEAYKNWLRNSIGSGYYYDSTDSSGLSSAYTQIFEEIKHMVAAGSEADWVAEDPLPKTDGIAENVEFIGFYDRYSQLTSSDLTGQHELSGENTASFSKDKSIISWDLKKSGYQQTSTSDSTIFTYQLVYRVRLKNEISGFAEENIYPTNDTTTLQYRTIEGTDGKFSVSDPKTIGFPIPSVHGYVVSLQFKKVDSNGTPLGGAQFTLTHDTDHCSVCRGDGTAVEIQPMTTVSGTDGIVTFTNVPSGHQYTLVETVVPNGYVASGNTYSVAVNYDQITVTVTAPDGTVTDWNGTVTNHIYYELPQTGGPGTYWYTVSGIAVLLLAAGLMYKKLRRRKEDQIS